MEEGKLTTGKSLNEECCKTNEERCKAAESRIVNILRGLNLLEEIPPEKIQCIVVEYQQQINLNFLPEDKEQEWIETIGLIMRDNEKNSKKI